jgi:hypothetical protein
MSFTDVWIGPECGVDIYEEPNEDVWVSCSTAQAKLGMMVGIPIIIIVIILCLWFGSTYVQVGAAIIGPIIIVLSILMWYWTPIASRNEFQRAQKEIKSRVDAGMSKATAIQEIQKERLKREEISANRRGQMSQAAGLFSIANSLRK